MDTTSITLITTLREIRGRLRSTLNSTDMVRQKLVGHRPQDSQISKSPEPSETVRGLVDQIDALSVSLAKAIDEHHTIIGNADREECAAPARGY